MSIIIIEPPKAFRVGQDLADPFPHNFCPAQYIDDFIAETPKQKSMADCVITTQELSTMDIPPRDYLIEYLMTTSSLMMIFAERGIGKTWVAMDLAISIAMQKNFLAYKVMRQGNVLYVDGEMVTSDMQARFNSMSGGISENISIMPSELLYQNNLRLNLHSSDDRNCFMDCLRALELKGRKFDVIIFDNLSSLASGRDENDNTEIEGLLTFLIELRHMGYAVVVIHHAGKSGDQRGASRREDLLDTVIRLRKPDLKDGQPRHDGAHFILDFTKTRGQSPNPQTLDAKLTSGESGKLEWTCTDLQKITRADDVLKVIGEINPKSQKDIAEHMELSKGTISSHISKLSKKKLIKGTQKLELTEAGVRRLLELWPSEFSKKFLNKEMPF